MYNAIEILAYNIRIRRRDREMGLVLLLLVALLDVVEAELVDVLRRGNNATMAHVNTEVAKAITERRTGSSHAGSSS